MLRRQWITTNRASAWIEIVALNNDSRELPGQRVATLRGDYQATVMAVADLVEAAERGVGAGGTVGIGIPGAESLVSGLIKNAGSTCLIGVSAVRGEDPSGGVAM